MNIEEAIEKMMNRRGYESPINAFFSDIQMKYEEGVMQAVQNVGIDVNKEELIKALSYDRGQYEKGYSEGHIDGFAKAEKIYAIPRIEWIPCSERLPEHGGYFLITNIDELVRLDYFRTSTNDFDNYSAIAWAPLPEPYREEASE